jgi:hypothetical protein
MAANDLIQASRTGVIFHLQTDSGAKAIVPHLFLSPDGIAFVDGEWTEPEAAGHVAHALEAEFVSGDATGAVFRKGGGQLVTLVPAFQFDPAQAIFRDHLKRTGRSQDEDRAAAKAAIERSLGITLADGGAPSP